MGFTNPTKLPDSDPVWEITGHYLAALCANLVLTVSPSVIVIGGGVLNRDILYDIVRTKTLELLKGYIESPKLTPGTMHFINRNPNIFQKKLASTL